MRILLLGIWLASVPVAFVLSEPHLRNPFDFQAEDTCVQPFEACNKNADCCQETHKFCNPNDRMSKTLGNQWCVTCRGDYDCPGTVTCENAGTERANCGMASLTTVEGMALIRQGYDIFLSDPLRSKSITDDGVQTSKIFQFDYLNGSHEGGNDFPKGFTASDDYPLCVSSFKSTSITSSSEMSSMISKSASVSASASIPVNAGNLDLSAGVGSGSYSSSTSAALNKEMTVTTKAECKIRVLRLTEYGPYPDLSTELINWLEQRFDGSNYIKLFQKFGTHVPHELTIGAAFGATTTVTESQQSEFTSESESLETTLSVGIPLLFKVDTTTGSVESKAASKRLKASGVESTTWSIGGEAVGSNEAFYEGAQTNPAPLIYKEMESLCKILQTKDIENFDENECYSSYIPYCKIVMHGTDFNCDVMIAQKNKKEFDCVFDSHCSERRVCRAGTCNSMLKILQTNSPNIVTRTSPLFSEENGGYSMEMPGPIYEIQCYDGNCDNKKLISIASTSQPIINKNSVYWTNWFSEEKTDWFGNKLRHQEDCKDDYVVTRIQCKDGKCDNMRLLCARLVRGYFVENAVTMNTRLYSDEQRSGRCNNGYYVTGMECSGGQCDNIALHCTRVKYQ